VPDLIIIAGPNGAGKTTFAKEYLSAGEVRFEFVNADEISRTLALEPGAKGRAQIFEPVE
jgi:predicted ABC-type ATPase